MSTNTPPRRSMREPQEVYARRRRRLLYGLLMVALIPLVVWLVMKWNRPLSAGMAAPARVDADTKRFTVLIMGADDRPGERGRSDTMLVGFVDLTAGSVNLLSIPRDSYVEIPGHGWNKINAAYAIGQTELARKTVENMIGSPVDYTFKINMQGFQQMVDAVGGVNVVADEDMDYEDPYDLPEPLRIHIQKGPQHLNGKEALGFVRFRHDAKSDWGRMERQQQFLKALLTAAKSPENLTKFPKLLSLSLDNIETNLSPSQLTQLAKLAKDKLGAQAIASKTLPGEDLWTDDGYYLALNYPEMRKMVHEIAGTPADATAEAKDAKDAAAYAAGLPSGTAEATAPAPTPVPPAQGSGSKPDTTPAPSPGAGTGGTTSKGPPGTGPTPGTSPTPGTGKGTTPGSGTGATPGAGTGKTPAPNPEPTPTPPPAPGANEPPQAADAPPPWPLVVVDGSGGTQSKLVGRLSQEGYKVLGLSEGPKVEQSTIIWYSGSAAAAYHLQVLAPHAKFTKMTPGPGDPALKLVLGSDG